MSLKNLITEDLILRWNSVLPEYLQRLAQLREDLIKIDKLRKELIIIREELVEREVEVDHDTLEENT